MEPVLESDSMPKQTCTTIVIIHEVTQCRHCRKTIDVNELALRTLEQSRQKQYRAHYYHLNGKCRRLHELRPVPVAWEGNRPY